MHKEAYDFVGQFATDQNLDVIEIGSRNINGTVRDHFSNAKWTGLDLYGGECVDVVCDMLDFTPDRQVDLVVCCEVLEHAQQWAMMMERASRFIKPGGMLIVTCAGPGRAPHSHIDGCRVRRGEYYGNVTVEDLKGVVESTGMRVLIARKLGNDTQLVAIKPEKS